MAFRSGNFTTDTLFDIRTTDILSLDLKAIDRVETDGFLVARDDGGATWLATGTTGTPSTFDFDNGRLNDVTGKSFKIQTLIPNPRLFGAEGNGVTDDIVAINSAIAFFQDSLRFLKGTYLISSSIIMTGSNGAVVGDGGAIIILDAAVNNDVIQVNSGSNIHIEGVTLDGNRTNQGGTSRGIHITGASSNIFIDNCLIQNMFTDGITSDVVNNGMFITNTRIQSLGRSGIVFPSTATGSDRSTFIDNVSVVDANEDGASSVSAIVISGTVHVSNIRIDSENGNEFTGIRFLGDPDPTKGAHGSTLTGFSIFADGLTADTEGLRLEATNLSISNGYIQGCEVGVFHQPTTGPDDNVVTGVHVSGGLAAAGASFSIQSTSDGTNFTGCTALDAPFIGFRVEGADHILFSGCVARDGVADGFRVDSPSTDTIFQDCLAVGCVTGMRLGAASDGTLISGCQFDSNTTAINNVTGTLATTIWNTKFEGNTTDITVVDEETVVQGHKSRTVASATTISITPEDKHLVVTGLTQIDFMTGGTPGQIITIQWDIGATFGVKQLAVPGDGNGVFDLLQGGGDPFASVQRTTLMVQAYLFSGETVPDWVEISRSLNDPSS